MIGIVYIQDIDDCVFLKKYREVLDKTNTKYKVIYWNRNSDIDEGIYRRKNEVEYRYYNDVKNSKFIKLYGFYKFRKFVISEIKDCDKLILLTTLSAVIIADKLSKYKDKYIFDFRDPSFEKNKVFQWLLKGIVKKSFFTCISSDKFRNILPKISKKYILVHNVSMECENLKKRFIKKNNQRLNIVYLGAVREYEHIRKQIDLFSESEKFNLYYHGKGSCDDELRKYVDKIGAENIFFTGYYKNSEKNSLLSDADIINDHYPNNWNYNLCVSNKYYDSLINHIPRLYNSENYFNEETGEIATRLRTNADLEFIYDSYHKIDNDSFDEYCDQTLRNINKDMERYCNKIEEFLSR